MIETHIPDYTNYKTDELIDVYVRIDKLNNPQKTIAIEEELRKRLEMDPDSPINENLIKKMYGAFHRRETIERINDTKYGGMIKAAWIGGLVSATITLLTFIFTLLDETTEITLINKMTLLVDIFIMYGLTFGVYKKSRVCAIIILIFFILAKLNAILFTGFNVPQLFLQFAGSLVFIALFIGGVIGTFGYHDSNIENEVEQTA